MRRRTDEVDYKPFVGLIRQDGTIGQYFLDCTQDKISGKESKSKPESVDTKEVIEILKEGDGSLDFKEAVIRWVEHNDVELDVQDCLLEMLDG